MLCDQNLPARPDESEVEPEVLAGEIVDDVPQRPAVVVLRPVVQVVAVAVQGQPAKTVARHGAYVAAGMIVAARRWHASRTRHERMMRSAEAAGDHAAALDWAKLAELERHQKHERRVKRVEAALAAAVGLPVIGGAWLVSMVLLGVLLWIGGDGPRGMAWPWVTMAHAVRFGVEVAPVVGMVLAIGVPVAVVLALYHTGRHAGDFAPSWTVTAKPGDEDSASIVTADTVVVALQNLDKIPPLKRAFKEGWRPAFTLLPVRDGRGYSAVFSLPLGVTPAMVADQRSVLARNLHREEIEVWPSSGPPGFASLFVADSGSISRAAPEYPLMHEGRADVFAGVPAGVTARGDGVLVPIAGNNFVAGGLQGQGKSNACRVVMLGCCTDPICELDVFVFAGNGDFDAYAPRLAVYHKGVEDDTIQAAVNRLHELYAEVGRREARLADLGAKKVTRGLAEAHADMRPIVALLSECHELFGHAEYGEIAAELAIKTIKRARKTGITLMFDTQSSRKAAIPPALVELVSVNCCFAVKTWRSNDGFLGDGSFQAGIRATELRPGRDRGTSLITGVSDAQFELLKWFYIAADDDAGTDDAKGVIERCMRTVDPRTPVSGSVPAIEVEQRDLLTDLAEVLRGHTGKVRVSDLPGMLRKLAPSWLPYRQLNGTQLRELLDREGIKTTNTNNVRELDPAELARAELQISLTPRSA
jgi:S-DNA-T family DNA segregation ATPase FtsK/SpoIIIE